MVFTLQTLGIPERVIFCSFSLSVILHLAAQPGNELTCNSSGSTQPQLSQLAEPLWTDPGVKSGISVPELSFAQNKIESAGGE